MKKWVVIYADLLGCKVKTTKINATSKIEALYKCATVFGINMGECNTTDVKEFDRYCLNMDCLISAYYIEEVTKYE